MPPESELKYHKRQAEKKDRYEVRDEERPAPVFAYDVREPPDVAYAYCRACARKYEAYGGRPFFSQFFYSLKYRMRDRSRGLFAPCQFPLHNPRYATSQYLIG